MKALLLLAATILTGLALLVQLLMDEEEFTTNNFDRAKRDVAHLGIEQDDESLRLMIFKFARAMRIGTVSTLMILGCVCAYGSTLF